jgi:hypothetical protein
MPAGLVNNGSAFVLQSSENYYLGTALHVVDAWLRRTEAGERLLFQVGHADLPPRDRFVWKSEPDDIAFLEIDAFDVQRIGVLPCETSGGWPPPTPRNGDQLMFAGFPGLLRERDGDNAVNFGSFVGTVSATTVREHHVVSQFEREHLISSDDRGVPPPGTDLGGMSGGPVFLLRKLDYPLVGLISEYSAQFELLRIATFGHLPPVLASR